MVYESLSSARFRPSAALIKLCSPKVAQGGASGTKTLVFPACSLCRRLGDLRQQGARAKHRVEPPQAPSASSGSERRWVPAATRRAASRGSESLQAEPPQRAQKPWEQPVATRSGSKAAPRCNKRGSCKVQKPRRNTSNQKAGIVSRQPARLRGAPGITSRARATLGITAARAPPHAGRWESLDTHAGTSASVSNHSYVPGEEQPNNLSIFRPSRGGGDHT